MRDACLVPQTACVKVVHINALLITWVDYTADNGQLLQPPASNVTQKHVSRELHGTEPLKRHHLKASHPVPLLTSLPAPSS